MTNQILIRAPLELKCKISQRAKDMGLTVNALVLQILWSWVEQQTDTET